MPAFLAFLVYDQQPKRNHEPLTFQIYNARCLGLQRCSELLLDLA